MSEPTLQESVAGLIGDAARVFAMKTGAAAEIIASIGPAELQVPRNPDHGDWASNIAMKLAKALKARPLDIATGIVGQIPPNDIIEKPEIAPPGFINLRLAASSSSRLLGKVIEAGSGWGRSREFDGRRIMVEFVSANPTGPLHVGHGRNAVVGDTLARIYAAAGYEVHREYYYNDAGVQMETLGRSLRIRYQQACGQDISFPDEGYKGDYMKEIAAELFAEAGDSKLNEEGNRFFTRYAADRIIGMINADLAALGISFDNYFLESSLHADGRVAETLRTLQAKDEVYEQDGALWLRSTKYGDEKDRVLRKKDGQTTYLMPDIAYHADKFARGFDRLVNVLGGDHHGYVARLKAALAALGYDPGRLQCVLIQMVGVKEGGEQRKLSTRAGDFVTLASILDDIGPDRTRYFYLLRSADSQMTIDLDLARQESTDNPYYYIQYVHARCMSLLAKAAEKGMPWRPSDAGAGLSRLKAAEERAIIFQIGRLPSIVAESARKDEPQLLMTYLRDLAEPFHAYYSAGNEDASLRCIQEGDPELTQARLTLISALRITVANALAILGIKPVDSFEKRAQAGRRARSAEVDPADGAGNCD